MNLNVVQVFLTDPIFVRQETRIAGELREVSGVLVHASDAARCEQHITRPNLKRRSHALGTDTPLTLFTAQLFDRRSRGILRYRHGDHACARMVINDEVDGGNVFENGHIGQPFDRREQRLGNLLACHIRMECDSRTRVRTFARERERTVLSPIEIRPQRHEVVDDRTG